MDQQKNDVMPAPDRRQGNFQCPTCCAPAGQPCASGCTEGTLSSAVRKAVEMLAAVDVSKAPLAVAGALGVLRCGLDAGERPSAQVAAPAPDTMYAALVLLATSTAAAPMITTMQKLALGRAQAVIKASTMPDQPRADSAGGPDEGELRAEFVRQHAGRDLSQNRLRGTYTSANIAALWNQHRRTAEWMAARSIPFPAVTAEGAAPCAAQENPEENRLLAQLARLRLKLNNTPMMYSSTRFDLAVEIDKLSAELRGAQSSTPRAETQKGGNA